MQRKESGSTLLTPHRSMELERVQKSMKISQKTNRFLRGASWKLYVHSVHVPVRTPDKKMNRYPFFSLTSYVLNFRSTLQVHAPVYCDI